MSAANPVPAAPVAKAPRPVAAGGFLILLLLVAGLFLFGLYRLFTLRFEAGDVYPRYSSLRADPLGTMAFYESLERLPGLSVRRDFAAGNRLPEAARTTYLHLAASSGDWMMLPEDLWREIDAFLARGSRLVITFLPETAPPVRFTPPPATTPPAKPKKSRKKADNQDEDSPRRVSLAEHWGVEFRHVPLETSPGGGHQPVQVENRAGLGLPPTLAWHSALVFTNAASWKTVYARGANAVVLQRRFGPGSVVLATDSYLLSNEALSKDRQPALLAWLVGPARSVVFDEAHFGIVEQAGTATLLRKYRLHGFVAGVILLVALFIWKNASSFVPPFPPDPETEPEQVAGKDAAAGFVNLLRRNIPPGEVLRVCFDEWTRSLPQSGHYSIRRVDEAQSVLEAEAARARTSQDPVRAYRQVCHALKGGSPLAVQSANPPPDHSHDPISSL